MSTVRLRRIKKQSGDYWYMLWTHPGCKHERSRGQRSQSLGPVTEITEKQARVQRDAKAIELRQLVQDPRAPTLREWAVTYLDWHAKEYPASHARVRQILNGWILPIPQIGDAPIDQIRRADVEAYKVSRAASPGTVAKELRTLQACLNKAVEWEIIARNPAKGVKPPQDLDDQPPKYFTPTEIQSICAVSPDPHWWMLMAHTGIRRGEALALKWDDVHGSTLRVLSTSRSRTKSGKSRGVPLNPSALEALSQFTQGDGYIFPRMHPRSLSRCFEKACERAGLRGSIHDLRHTFCTWLVLKGVHPRKIQSLAGHSVMRVTEQYTKLLPTDLLIEVQRIG